MAMSGTGMMMGMAAGQALAQMLIGGGSGGSKGMMGGMPGMMGGMGRGGRSGGQSNLLGSGLDMMKQAGQGVAKAGARIQRAVFAAPVEPFALVSRQPGRRRSGLPLTRNWKSPWRSFLPCLS